MSGAGGGGPGPPRGRRSGVRLRPPPWSSAQFHSPFCAKPGPTPSRGLQVPQAFGTPGSALPSSARAALRPWSWLSEQHRTGCVPPPPAEESMRAGRRGARRAGLLALGVRGSRQAARGPEEPPRCPGRGLGATGPKVPAPGAAPPRRLAGGWLRLQGRTGDFPPSHRAAGALSGQPGRACSSAPSALLLSWSGFTSAIPAPSFQGCPAAPHPAPQALSNVN